MSYFIQYCTRYCTLNFVSGTTVHLSLRVCAARPCGRFRLFADSAALQCCNSICCNSNFALSQSCVWRWNVNGSLKFVPALLWCCVCVRGCVDMACVRCLVLSALYFALFGGPWTGWGDPTEQSFVATGQCSVFYTNQRHVIAIPSPPTIRELGYTGVTVTVAFGLSHL